MDKIVGIISKAPTTRSQNDDDFADRLSSRYTVVLLLVFAILVGMNQVRLKVTVQPSLELIAPNAASSRVQIKHMHAGCLLK
jgi:hypothetical protein